ncbi:MAG: endonuclease III [Planctomycetota bacterium]
MPRESQKARGARAERLLELLGTAHPDARCALDFETPFQLLAATILSAQNTDENVNKVTPKLFARYPDAAAMAEASRDELEELVHATGFFRQKAKSLSGMALALVERHGGEVPLDRDDLVKLPGVGRKTANLVLGVCFDVPGIVVDTHVSRLVQRWRLTAATDPVKIEQDLMQCLPEASWTQFSHATIFHGRRVCAARKPKCEQCTLVPECPSAAASPPPRRRRGGAASALLLAVACAAAACEGGGSDIGPTIPIIADADYRVLVRDDAGRAVSAARVTVEGISAAGASNSRGRAIVAGAPSGQRLVTVDGTAASAVATDALGGLVVSADTSTRELPWTLHLPDLAASNGLALATGTQPGAVVLDDTTTSGAVVTLPSGASVGLGASTTVLIRTGPLAAHHLPLPLPLPASGERLFGAGVFIGPSELTITPGAALSMPNDLGLAAGGSAELWRLDAATGVWVVAGSGTVDGAGARIEASPGVVAVGGLYAFATTAVPAGNACTVVGRVVDAAGFAVAAVRLRVGRAVANSNDDGTFALGPIPATDAAGADRRIPLELHGSRDQLPLDASFLLELEPGSINAGDVELETGPVGILRMQLINRGGTDPRRRMNVSSALGVTVGFAVGDGEARACFDDQAADDFVGTLTSRVLDDRRVLIAEASRFLPRGRHHIDLQIFSREADWWSGRRSGSGTDVFVVDADGTGPLRFVPVIRGVTPEQGFLANTRETGVVTGDFGVAGRATAVSSSSIGGTTVVSAFSFVDVDGSRIEIPLQRARRTGGSFERHGLARGTLAGAAGAGRERRMRASRFQSIEGWFDEVMLDRPGVSLPIKVDPASTGGLDYRIGVPVPEGHIAAVEGVNAVDGFALERLGFALRVAPIPGGELSRDVALSRVADTDFLATEALRGLHPAIADADLEFDLGLQFAGEVLLDVARDLDGGFTRSGDSAVFRLPALVGPMVGGRWLVALAGEQTAGGVTVAQRSLIPLDAASIPSVSLLEVPDIISPAPGATVDATGFAVRYTVPAGTTYLEVRLRSEIAGEVRDWTAVLPPMVDSFEFIELPEEAAAVLAPSRTWQLRVTAARIETGPLITGPMISPGSAYRRIMQNWVGISAGEREVNALASTEITVLTGS